MPVVSSLFVEARFSHDDTMKLASLRGAVKLWPLGAVKLKRVLWLMYRQDWAVSLSHDVFSHASH